MSHRNPLNIQIPSQGWKQFLTSRKEMLDAYDSAREKAKSHGVETYHGKVAEAEFRKWLSNFLPKHYGVTSGYIISQGVSSEQKAPHFDVIVYDSIESPILWIEDNPDTSNAGKSMAIPAEYVYGVLEVKSSFNTKSVNEAIEHLSELGAIMGGLDDPNERYKKYLPSNFFCGIVFFELREDSQYSEKALSGILGGMRLRGFVGGIILRGENHIKPATGRILLINSDTQMESNITIGEPKTSLLSGDANCKTVELENHLHVGVIPHSAPYEPNR